MKPKQIFLKDAVVSGSIIQQAIIDILEKKGIANKKEIVEEVKKIKKR